MILPYRARMTLPYSLPSILSVLPCHHCPLPFQSNAPCQCSPLLSSYRIVNYCISYNHSYLQTNHTRSLLEADGTDSCWSEVPGHCDPVSPPPCTCSGGRLLSLLSRCKSDLDRLVPLSSFGLGPGIPVGAGGSFCHGGAVYRQHGQHLRM